jgi:hypothetical protein
MVLKLVKKKNSCKTLSCNDINKFVALNFVLYPEKSSFKNQFPKFKNRGYIKKF